MQTNQVGILGGRMENSYTFTLRACLGRPEQLEPGVRWRLELDG